MAHDGSWRAVALAFAAFFLVAGAGLTILGDAPADGTLTLAANPAGCPSAADPAAAADPYAACAPAAPAPP